ncbi:MAG: universal stress protein [Acidobacteriota bacterium]|nr:MAG: universal stress protein [Acidobacteriota bacterium]
MKILISYDGSETADYALTDLQRAGLPLEAEVIVISIAESWLPPPSGYEVIEQIMGQKHPRQLEEALALAKRAADVISAFFPGWTVHLDAHHGSPAGEVVRKAESFGADLIVVGSHGLSGLGRILLGSISHKIVTDAHCSVRVARKRHVTTTPPKLIVGLDGSEHSERAIQVVASRRWPEKTEVRLVTATGPFYELPMDSVETQLEYTRKIQQRAVEILQHAKLDVTTVIEVTDPKTLLLEEAEKWDADCIFIGTRGHNKLERLLLGSVASAVVSRANCTVEVVRIH